MEKRSYEEQNGKYAESETTTRLKIKGLKKLARTYTQPRMNMKDTATNINGDRAQRVIHLLSSPSAHSLMQSKG